MWGGDGAYVPSPSSAVDTTLRLHETVKVFDMGLVAHPARAVLDSGAFQGIPCSNLATPKHMRGPYSISVASSSLAGGMLMQAMHICRECGLHPDYAPLCCTLGTCR